MFLVCTQKKTLNKKSFELEIKNPLGLFKALGKALDRLYTGSMIYGCSNIFPFNQKLSLTRVIQHSCRETKDKLYKFDNIMVT